jgi:hypothetical protein
VLALTVSAGLAGSGGNGDDYVFTSRRFVDARGAP